jgi:hypothetical protein
MTSVVQAVLVLFCLLAFTRQAAAWSQQGQSQRLHDRLDIICSLCFASVCCAPSSLGWRAGRQGTSCPTASWSTAASVRSTLLRRWWTCWRRCRLFRTRSSNCSFCSAPLRRCRSSLKARGCTCSPCPTRCTFGFASLVEGAEAAAVDPRLASAALALQEETQLSALRFWWQPEAVVAKRDRPVARWALVAMLPLVMVPWVWVGLAPLETVVDSVFLVGQTLLEALVERHHLAALEAVRQRQAQAKEC